MDYETEVAIPQIARDVLESYYRTYLDSYGDPLKTYFKLLMNAEGEDKEEMAKAFEKAFKEVGTEVYKEVTAEFLGVPVEDLEGVLTWAEPPELENPLI